MKSSDAVFTRQNPFRPKSPVGKTHYHPSRIQSLSKTKKKTSLSPVRLNQQGHTVGQETQQQFDKHDHHLTLNHPVKDGQRGFSESWPATDCSMSPDSAMVSSVMETQKPSAAERNTTESSELDIQEESVLARYIEHFRHGRAQSREERQQMLSAIGEEQLPTNWRMSPSLLPSSSTPNKATEKALKDDHLSPPEHDGTPSPCRESCSILSDMSNGEFDDTDLQHLQEKASRLLQRSEWPVSDGSVPVSPEGLGWSDFSSLSVDEPVERPFISSNFPEKSTAGTVKPSSVSVQAGPNSKSSVIPSLVPPTRPEEDILFQWRLRRKMEQAREWPQSQPQASTQGSTFSWQGPSQHNPSASGQGSKQQGFQPPESSQPQIKEALRPCPPASGHPPVSALVVSDSSVSQPQTVVHVPPHMHFLCDVLPCPIQSSRLGLKERISQKSDEYPTKTVPKRTPVIDASTDEHRKHVSPPPPASSGGVEERWPSHHKRAEKDKNGKAQSKESEKNEKKIRKQKQSSRFTVAHTDMPKLSNKSSSPHTATKKAKRRTAQHQQERCKGFSSEICSRDQTPLPSPVHSALGQIHTEDIKTMKEHIWNYLAKKKC